MARRKRRKNPKRESNNHQIKREPAIRKRARNKILPRTKVIKRPPIRRAQVRQIQRRNLRREQKRMRRIPKQELRTKVRIVVNSKQLSLVRARKPQKDQSQGTQ